MRSCMLEFHAKCLRKQTANTDRTNLHAALHQIHLRKRVSRDHAATLSEKGKKVKVAMQKVVEEKMKDKSLW